MKFEVPHIGANVTLLVRSATYNLDNQITSQTIGGVTRTITSNWHLNPLNSTNANRSCNK